MTGHKHDNLMVTPTIFLHFRPETGSVICSGDRPSAVFKMAAICSPLPIRFKLAVEGLSTLLIQ
jgi:hypothetical protein